MVLGYSTDSSVDRGWAWMVMLGTFIWNVTVSGTLKSFGVLYVEFIDLFGTSPTQTSWIGFTFCFMMLVLSPVAGYIGDHFSPRWIIFCGSLVACSGVFLTGFAVSLPYAILSYGIIAGGAVGIMDCFVFGTLNKYFHTKRAFANSISFIGSGIGCLAIPVLLRMCVDFYNLQGAMFILAGIWLHSCIIGALFRPMKFKQVVHEKFVVLKVANGEETNNEHEINGTSYKQNNIDEISQSMEAKLFHTNKISNDLEENTPQRTNDSLESNKENIIYEKFKTKGENDVNMNNSISRDKDLLKNDLNDISGAFNITSKHSNFKEGFQDYLTFLNNPQMIRLVLAIMFGSFAYFNQFFLFPPLSEELHLTKMQGALLVALTGTTEMCSRLPLGYLCDKPFMNKELLVASLSVLCSIIGLVVSFMPERLALIAYSGILGVIGGTTVPLGMPMLADVVHKEKINSAAGLFLWAMGVALAVGPPVLGGVQMYFGSYIYSYRLCVSMYIPAAALLVWNVISKYLQMKTKSEES